MIMVIYFGMINLADILSFTVDWNRALLLPEGPYAAGFLPFVPEESIDSGVLPSICMHSSHIYEFREVLFAVGIATEESGTHLGCPDKLHVTLGTTNIRLEATQSKQSLSQQQSQFIQQTYILSHSVFYCSFHFKVWNCYTNEDVMMF